MCVLSRSVVSDPLPTRQKGMDIVYQATLSMGFPRQESWIELSFPSPQESSWPRNCLLWILHWQADSLPLSHLGYKDYPDRQRRKCESERYSKERLFPNFNECWVPPFAKTDQVAGRALLLKGLEILQDDFPRFNPLSPASSQLFLGLSKCPQTPFLWH